MNSHSGLYKGINKFTEGFMRVFEIVRIDSRGRIILPSSIRDSVGLPKGMYVMLIADLDKKEIRITPFADPEAKLVEFHIELLDVPGALAHAAAILAENGVDLLSTESRTLRRGKVAEWCVIADVSKCKCELKELKRRIEESDVVGRVELRGFPP